MRPLKQRWPAEGLRALVTRARGVALLPSHLKSVAKYQERLMKPDGGNVIVALLAITIIAIVGWVYLNETDTPKTKIKPKKKNATSSKDIAKSKKTWAEAPFLIYEDVKEKRRPAKKTRR